MAQLLLYIVFSFATVLNGGVSIEYEKTDAQQAFSAHWDWSDPCSESESSEDNFLPASTVRDAVFVGFEARRADADFPAATPYFLLPIRAPPKLA